MKRIFLAWISYITVYTRYYTGFLLSLCGSSGRNDSDSNTNNLMNYLQPKHEHLEKICKTEL